MTIDPQGGSIAALTGNTACAQITSCLLYTSPQHRATNIVIVNRAASGSPLSWNEVERILGREVRANVSLASELTTQSLIANVPVVMLQPTAIVSSQVIKLAEDLNNIGRLMASRETIT